MSDPQELPPLVVLEVIHHRTPGFKTIRYKQRPDYERWVTSYRAEQSTEVLRPDSWEERSQEIREMLLESAEMSVQRIFTGPALERLDRAHDALHGVMRHCSCMHAERAQRELLLALEEARALLIRPRGEVQS